MLLHPPTLLVATSASLVIASAAAAAIGVRQRLRRGVWWWIAANLGLAASLTCHALVERDDMLAPLASLLALQWPIVTLAGMRRFFARGEHAVPPWVDWLVMALAGIAAAGAAVAPFEWASPAQILAVAMMILTLHAAIAVGRLEDFATTPALKALLIGLVCSAALQGAWFGLAASPLAAALGSTDVALAALLAPATTALLLPQLSLVLVHERNVAQLRASQRKLRHLVEVDPLTRLPNRRHFHELAGKVVQPAPELATVLVFDVDRLKHINDVLGHSVGDEALRQIGTALRETLRRRDVAGRLGGDEFAAVLPRTREADAAAAVARINARLDDRQVAPRIARVKLNVGITQMKAGESIADALRRAEILLETARDEARRKAADAAAIFAAVAGREVETVAAALEDKATAAHPPVIASASSHS